MYEAAQSGDEDFEVTEEEVAELERRSENRRTGKSPVFTWEEVMLKIKGKK